MGNYLIGESFVETSLSRLATTVAVQRLGYQPSANLLELTGVVHVHDNPLLLSPSLPENLGIEAPIRNSEELPPLNWKPEAMQWAVEIERLKLETVEAIASRTHSYDEFVRMVKRAVAIRQAIEQGIEETTAKALMKDCLNDVNLFHQEVERWFSTVEVSVVEEDF